MLHGWVMGSITHAQKGRNTKAFSRHWPPLCTSTHRQIKSKLYPNTRQPSRFTLPATSLSTWTAEATVSGARESASRCSLKGERNTTMSYLPRAEPKQMVYNVLKMERACRKARRWGDQCYALSCVKNRKCAHKHTHARANTHTSIPGA